MTAEDLIRRLRLVPLAGEGGFFRETLRSAHSSAIYYLLTPDTFSALHRLPGDEIFHFYVGDPVEMLQLRADGTAATVLVGADVARGMQPQVVVPGGTWQGCRLVSGGTFALLGTTMAPGFDLADFELGDRAVLIGRFPAHAAMIAALTR
ncbi:MAG: cupin domain-containing protein [Candidatus Eisenbacteria bacterium]|nr:cupin domain-containing protein [Candidatus Eisenbacteria bacterium]